MKITDIFGKLKKEYREIAPRKSFRQEGWKELKILLDKPETKTFWTTPMFRWITPVVILLFVGATTIFAAATQAQPGDSLYPVRQFSEHFVSSITPRPTLIEQPSDLKKIIKEPKQQISPTTIEENVASKSGENTTQKDGQDKKEEKQEIKKTVESIIQVEAKKEDKKTETLKEKNNKEDKVEEKVKELKDVLQTIPIP